MSWIVSMPRPRGVASRYFELAPSTVMSSSGLPSTINIWELTQVNNSCDIVHSSMQIPVLSLDAKTGGTIGRRIGMINRIAAKKRVALVMTDANINSKTAERVMLYCFIIRSLLSRCHAAAVDGKCTQPLFRRGRLETAFFLDWISYALTGHHLLRLGVAHNHLSVDEHVGNAR